jgi:hypothetical protein
MFSLMLAGSGRRDTASNPAHPTNRRPVWSIPHGRQIETAGSRSSAGPRRSAASASGAGHRPVATRDAHPAAPLQAGRSVAWSAGEPFIERIREGLCPTISSSARCSQLMAWRRRRRALGAVLACRDRCSNDRARARQNSNLVMPSFQSKESCTTAIPNSEGVMPKLDGRPLSAFPLGGG